MYESACKTEAKGYGTENSEQDVLMAYKDARTPIAAKLLIGLTVAYLLSPIDLIPDFIPVIGLLNDLLIVPLVIDLSIKLLPGNVLDDGRHAAIQHSDKRKQKTWWFAVKIVFIWILVAYLAIEIVANMLC